MGPKALLIARVHCAYAYNERNRQFILGVALSVDPSVSQCGLWTLYILKLTRETYHDRRVLVEWKMKGKKNWIIFCTLQSTLYSVRTRLRIRVSVRCRLSSNGSGHFSFFLRFEMNAHIPNMTDWNACHFLIYTFFFYWPQSGVVPVAQNVAPTQKHIISNSFWVDSFFFSVLLSFVNCDLCDGVDKWISHL